MCCLFVVIDYKGCLSAKKKEKIIKVLSKECEERGTDATGIAYMKNNKIKIYKKPLPAHKMVFRFNNCNPKIIMGHTRFTTQGHQKYNFNNHPFFSPKLYFALAHNGVLYNDDYLKSKENLPKTKIETDSYVALQLLEKSGELSMETIKSMAETVNGTFCFTILDDKNSLYIVKGDNPMAIAKFDGFYIYASTSKILLRALNKLKIKKYETIEITEGDIFKFDLQGNITKSKFIFDNSFNYAYSTKNNKYFNNYLDDILYYARSLGFDEDDVTRCVEDGYTLDEVLDFLYEYDVSEV